MDMLKQAMIGEILIARGAITRDQLKMANKFQESARKLGETFVDDGLVSPKDLDIALGWQLAEAIVGLGYASEREVFGSLRVSVAPERISLTKDCQIPDRYDDRDLEDFSDF